MNAITEQLNQHRAERTDESNQDLIEWIVIDLRKPKESLSSMRLSLEIADDGSFLPS